MKGTGSPKYGITSGTDISQQEPYQPTWTFTINKFCSQTNWTMPYTDINIL